ncbi:MAG TPA: hypothetical protein VF292_11725 [Rhodanobacteraceae bacterium]
MRVTNGEIRALLIRVDGNHGWLELKNEFAHPIRGRERRRCMRRVEQRLRGRTDANAIQRNELQRDIDANA